MSIRQISKIIIPVLTAILLVSCFSEENRDSAPGSETESNHFAASDEVPFAGNDPESFASSIKEIDDRPDEFGVYAAAKEKILSGEAFIFLPEDEERITYLGASIHSPGTNIIITNNNVMAEAAEICTVCRFNCLGREYSISFDSYVWDIPDNVEKCTIAGNEVNFVIYMDTSGYKHANCCIFELDGTAVTLRCSEGYLFEDISVGSYEHIVELMNLFSLKKKKLSDFLNG